MAQTSTLTGNVEDATTGEPLIGVNIIVTEVDGMGTTTDEKGNFKLLIFPGGYSVKVSYLGYIPVVKTDVIILSGKETNLSIKLVPSSIQMNEAVIQADYFDKSIQQNNLATIVLSPEEIRRSPGSMQDFQRILQGMAGVSFSNDQNNELLVRGGSPNENLTVLDEMELHSTNHYPNEYNSGGPINMVNVDLIENIQFSTGGFISKFGDKLSSVMQISTREGTRNKSLSGNVNLSMAGYGGVFEGTINNGAGSWIVSARKSYINLIAGAVGLTAIPYYYDFQFKTVYNLSDNHKLSWSGIYGNDKILIEGDDEKSDYFKRNSVDTIGAERINVKQFQYATGITLKSILSKNSYSLLTLYFNGYNNDVDVSTEYTRYKYDSNGDVSGQNMFYKCPLFSDEHKNRTLALKGDVFWQVAKGNDLNFGGSIATADFIQRLNLPSNSARYYINGSWTPTITVPGSDLKYNIKLFDYYKYYAFVNDRMKLFNDRFEMNLGLRYDYFGYSDKGNLSPRFSCSYYLIPAITSLNFAYGEYYQTQSYPTYGDREKSEINRYLKNTHSRHFIAGIEHILDDGLKANLEFYQKDYNKIPVSEEFVHFYDKTYRSNRNLNVGVQTIRGIDFMIQQKLVKDIFGTLSYSRIWTEYEDPRIGYEGETITSDYDFPHVLTIILGKRFSGVRTALDNSNFVLNYLSYLLPFSDDMEISLRWRYASGKPYTKRMWTTYEQYYDEVTGWSDGAWSSDNELNDARYPDYHRLDFAFNSRYNFSSWSIAVFLSIQNLYNRSNVAFYQYNTEGEREDVNQFSFLPVVGIDVRF